jgi:class 3 adenylate cyclase
VEQLGIQIRAGVHTGECEHTDHNFAGLAVHVGARVAAMAGPGEVWVSRTVRDVVAGSDIGFEPRGTHRLKGVPEPCDLYSVIDRGLVSVAVTVQPARRRITDRLVFATGAIGLGAATLWLSVVVLMPLVGA